MAVRLLVEISFGRGTVRTVAVANAGYETQSPQILIPKKLAVKNWKKVLSKASGVEYNTPGGRTTFKSLGVAKVTVVAQVKSSSQIQASLFASDHEDEVLLSDKLIGALSIELTNVGEGKWRFRDDPPATERESAPAEYW